MLKLEDSDRVKCIENRFNVPIKDLLYQMHWLEDMKHRDIALRLHAPRATVTRWFHRLSLPTQSCRRFTDKNLTSWLYKAGLLKKKSRHKDLEIKPRAIIDFFKKWSMGMAYILGYFAADGSMYANPRGAKYITFSSTDREMVEKVKRCLNSNHKIGLKKRDSKNWKSSYTFQIGSKEMYADLINLGFMQNKARRFNLPKVPKKYMNHFIRGYFDGDGSVTYGYYTRRSRGGKKTPYILSSFASANAHFLKNLSRRLSEYARMKQGYINAKSGHLKYSKLDSSQLFRYMYKGVFQELYLERKYNKFKKALTFIGAVA